MNTIFLSRTVNVLFFSFLTLVSTIYLLERFGVDLLKWRAGSSLLLAYTSALSGAGFPAHGLSVSCYWAVRS